MGRWKATLCVLHDEVKLLVTDEMGDDVLRARLPRRCDHPRAVLTLLEGLAMWSGAVLPAAISVEVGVQPGLFGDVLWPADSALVRLDFVPERVPRRIQGLGSFRDVLAARTRS